MTHRVTISLVLSASGVLLSAVSGSAVLVALSVTGFLLLNAKVVPDTSRWAVICCTAGALFGGTWGSLVALSMTPGVLRLRDTLVKRDTGRRLYVLCGLTQAAVLWLSRHDTAALMLATTVLSYLLISILYRTSKEVRAVMAAVCLSQVAFMYDHDALPLLLIASVTVLLLPLRLSKHRRRRR